MTPQKTEELRHILLDYLQLLTGCQGNCGHMTAPYPILIDKKISEVRLMLNSL